MIIKRLLTPILLVALFLASCAEFEELEQAKDFANPSVQTRSNDDLTAFDSLPDPYALENMQAVYDEFNGTRVLQPTDLYVRFMPQDSTQMNFLEDFYDLDLFDYPLDFDIPAGEEYIDPTIADGQPGWLYTTVKHDFDFPEDMMYEIIRECYIPMDGEKIPPTTRSGEIDVELAAYERLGYSIGPLTRSGGDGGQKPTGRITVLDDAGADTVPVKKVRIKVNSHTKIDRAYTNEDGRYTMDKRFWDENVNYVVVFRNEKDFIIWRKLATRAKYHYGKKSKGGCDIHISSGEEWQWAAINNAAYDYYKMCEVTGLTKPPEVLRIWTMPNAPRSSAPMIRRFAKERVYSTSNWAAFLASMAYISPASALMILEPALKFLEPDVTIGTNSRDYREIYESVSHELSHASHFNQIHKGNRQYWPQYVGYIIDSYLGAGNTYGDGTGQYTGVCAVGEMWGYAMGHIQECEHYNETVLLQDSYFSNFDRAGDGGWIRPDPIWALITRGVLTKRQVFDCLTSDVDTVDKLINKMCAKYPSKAAFIRLAFEDNDTMAEPAVTGPVDPVLNTTVTYSVPAGTTLPAGVAFTGFTFTGTAGHTIVSNAGGQLRIKFTSSGTKTIAANYRITTNSGTVDYATPAFRVFTERPTLTSITSKGVVIEGKSIVFTANGAQNGATYEWRLETGGTVTGGNTSRTFSVIASTNQYVPTIKVCCQAHLNGFWTNTLYAEAAITHRGEIIGANLAPSADEEDGVGATSKEMAETGERE